MYFDDSLGGSRFSVHDGRFVRAALDPGVIEGVFGAQTVHDTGAQGPGTSSVMIGADPIEIGQGLLGQTHGHIPQR